MPDFFEEALASIGAAIKDVREKVVEEPYFGRSLSGGDNSQEIIVIEGAPAPTESNAFEQALQEISSASQDNSRDIQAPEPGGGMEP